MVLLYTVCFVEGADLQLLPSSFRALERDLGLRPTSLAILSLCQGISSSLTAPFWGVLVDNGASGKQILVMGAAAWGLLTLLLAMVSNFYSMVFLRTLNGAALATLTPISQCIIAMLTKPEERGLYFGGCGVAMSMGYVFCAVFATPMSNIELMGLHGWRVAFASVAIVSFQLAALLAFCLPDLKRQTYRQTCLQHELSVFAGYCRIRSFMVIIVQGICGSVPWSALGFLTTFFQYMGIPDIEAGALLATMTLALGFGHAIGGAVGDASARYSRYHGRPLTAQISSFAGIPMIYCILKLVPRVPESSHQFGVLLIMFGLMASWCGVGVNRPILTEIVPESGQARAVSWLAALEGSMAACMGAPLVAVLAEEYFGYEPQLARIAEVPEAIRNKNVQALGQGMLVMTVVPWTLCFIAFGLLHFTYKKDVENMALEQSEGRRLH